VVAEIVAAYSKERLLKMGAQGDVRLTGA